MYQQHTRMLPPQCVRCVTAREAVEGQEDLVHFLCSPRLCLLQRLLAMLASLPPIQNRRQSAAAAAGTITAGAGPSSTPDVLQQPHQDVSVAQQCLAALPEHLTQHLPSTPPYIGYRGDLLACLGNALAGRPDVADAVADVPGAVPLILSQASV